ncbi:outer membrane beta-barrel protein [Chryseolinea sp. T2]|uniref:outer membrane beta-barrel protein n=1 Tax=Chryseolinea sp. T2 TaxID=3129255 RepID=UPI00307789BF
MRKLLSCLGLMLALLSTCLCAQSRLTIEGHVIDAKNDVVSFATVLLKHVSDSTLLQGTTSGEKGEFQFTEVLPGRYYVQVQFVGYETFKGCAIALGTKSITIEPIVLSEKTKLLKEVTIQGQRPTVVQEDGKLILNVSNTVIGSSGSAIELLVQAPGVSVDQNDQISLNGKSGITILLDDKVTYLQPSELAALLRSMNASNIASIEIITNPGARFDAAGSSGVINIKSKKKMLTGFNGSAQMGIGIGRYPKIPADVNLNYRTKKWVYFLSANYNFNKRFSDVTMDRSSYPNGAPTYFDLYTKRVQRLTTRSWHFGTEWQWNEKNSITISTTGSVNNRDSDALTVTNIGSSESGEPDSTFTVSDLQYYNWRYQTAALGFKHLFKKQGQELTFDADYSIYSFDLGDDISVEKQDVLAADQYNITSTQPTAFNVIAARLDYTFPVNTKTTFEIGMKVSEVKTRSDVTYRNNQSGKFTLDTARSNDFDYTEIITAAYANLKSSVAGFQTQLGLRAESTSYDGVSVLKGQSISRNYFKIFPTFNTFKNVTESYRIGLSYSYRIDRPAYNDLYPFVFYIDPFSGQRGNPNLLPQFTHAVQFSQTFAKTYTVNLGYSNTSQYMAFLILLDSDNTSGYATRLNFDHCYNYNLSVVAPITLSPKWTANVSINAFFNQYSTQFRDNTATIAAFSGLVNIIQTILLPWGLTGEIVAIYNAPNVSGLFQTRAYGTLNLGLQKTFMKKKATLRLSANDMFSTTQMINNLEYPGLDLVMDNRFETRIVRLNFAYNFGMSGKSTHRRIAQDEEQRRVNTN